MNMIIGLILPGKGKRKKLPLHEIQFYLIEQWPDVSIPINPERQTKQDSEVNEGMWVEPRLLVPPCY